MQPSFCHVSCFRQCWALLSTRKPLLCCDTLREMCHRVADRKWMVSQTHRQLTSTEDSSKCGRDVVAAWWQPAGCDTALLAEGPTPALEAITFLSLMGTNLRRRRERKTFLPDGYVSSLSNPDVIQRKWRRKQRETGI